REPKYTDKCFNTNSDMIRTIRRNKAKGICTLVMIDTTGSKVLMVNHGVHCASKLSVKSCRNLTGSTTLSGDLERL
ncbi:unnamed protein product, partial [Musa acuminata subsp. burmannicoides]